MHTHSHEHKLAPSGNATVVLDIGDGVGALVVHTPAALLGREIELARAGEPRAFVHTEVRERRLRDHVEYAGVFPEITEGEYRVLGLDGRADECVTIRSAAVTEVRW